MVKGWGMKANIFNNVWHKLYKWRISPRPIGLGPDMKQLESLSTAWFHWYFRSFLTSSKLKLHSLSNLSLESLKFAWNHQELRLSRRLLLGNFWKKYQVPTVGGFFGGNVHPSILLKSNVKHNESSTSCMFSIGQWHHGIVATESRGAESVSQPTGNFRHLKGKTTHWGENTWVQQKLGGGFRYWQYIPLIYCQLGDYMVPTTY